MEYYTEHTRPATIPNDPGSHFRDVRKRVKDEKTGQTYYKKVSRVNTYEKIQAALEDTLITNILSKFEAGQVDVINKSQGFYGDTTGIPKDFNTLHEMNTQAAAQVNTLPTEIKEKILAGEEVTDKDILSYVESLQQQPQEQVKSEEVKANE